MTTATFPEVGTQFVYRYDRPWLCDGNRMNHRYEILMVVASVDDRTLLAETVEVLAESNRPTFACNAPHKASFADFGWSNAIANGQVEVK
jgi:hypothetical protein